MGEYTKVEWAESSWNPWYGCRKVSPGCDNCYAEVWAKRSGRDFNTVTRASDRTFYAPTYWDEPKRIFTCSLSDFFIRQADEWREDAWTVMKATPQHTYMILTKRPGRMVAWSYGHKWPRHIWAGISISTARYLPWLKFLYEMKCHNLQLTTFISGEPLLDSLDGLASYLNWKDLDAVPISARSHFRPCLDLVILGGESGSRARPMELSWLESVISQCRDADVPCFVKQDSGRYPGQQGRIPDDLWTLKQLPEPKRRV